MKHGQQCCKAKRAFCLPCDSRLSVNACVCFAEVKSLPGGWKVVKDIHDLEKLLDPQGILSSMSMASKK
jgi:hypothetical protein